MISRDGELAELLNSCSMEANVAGFLWDGSKCCRGWKNSVRDSWGNVAVGHFCGASAPASECIIRFFHMQTLGACLITLDSVGKIFR